jgi:hypothetical protein
MNNSDRKYLKLLSIFHYLLGGLNLVISIGYVVYMVWFWNFLSTTRETDLTTSQAPYNSILTIWFFWPLIIFTYSICLIVSGRLLTNREGYWFSFVVACIECLVFPLGTILGIITLIILLRDSVRTLYGLNQL